MAAADTMIDLIGKANNLSAEIASGWYKGSQAMKSFPIQLSQLRLKSDMYASLLRRYGMKSDPYIEELLRKVIELLDEEDIKVQQLQDQCCLCRIGRKLLFPDSITTELDIVIAAYESLSKHLSERDTVAQQLEKASLNKRRLLPFEHDEQYVPIGKSVEEVRDALERDSSCRIVVISGGSGQGKSSLARYLACLYQDGIPTMSGARRMTDPASSSFNLSSQTFKDGVIFLRCGTNVNTKSLIEQLWQDMGYGALPTSKSQRSVDDGSDVQEEDMRSQLSSWLKNQRVLIVLDDVWDRRIVDKLKIPGKWIKYLVTTQISNFRNDAIEIVISKPRMQEARNIIANYVVGYDPKYITWEIRMEIEAIIEKSDYIPLVLANVATYIQDGAASQVAEWKLARKYHADLQDGDEKRPVSLYGHSYSKRNLGASMEMALDSFTSEEQTLVLLVSMFEERPIPEVVFKILFKSKHSLAKFSQASQHLEKARIIDIQSAKTRWSAAPRKTWSIHSMRRTFFRQIKEKEITLMFNEMWGYGETQKIVAMLSVLYGEVPRNSETINKRGIQSNPCRRKARSIPIPLIEPFVWQLNADPEGGSQQCSHQAAVQVLHEYLLSLENYNKLLSKLLENPHTFLGTCEVFYRIYSWYSTDTMFRLQEISNKAVATLVQTLALSNTSELQKHATLTICIVSQKINNAIKIGSFPNAVDRLVALLQEGVSPEVQNNAAWALGQLSANVVGNSAKIGFFPNAVERLVALLQEGVSPETQDNATWALGQLSRKSVNNAIKIGSCPNAIERLVALLQERVSPEIQCAVAWALGQLSANVVDNSIKIGLFPNAVERLVALLQKGVSPDVQGRAARALGQLAANVVDNSAKIGSFPNAIERLVALLEEGVSPEVQGRAAEALGQLSINLMDNSAKIGLFPNAVERLVALLQEEVNPEVQGRAAWALGQLSTNVVDISARIGLFPNAVERLVALLQEGVNPHVQGRAAWALGQLSTNVVDNSARIGVFPNAMERLVALLQEEVSPQVQGRAAWALGQLCTNVVDNSIKIGSIPTAMDRLVALLQEEVSPEVQGRAAWALGQLSRNVVNNSAKIASFPNAVDRLVVLLEERVIPEGQCYATWAL